MSNQKQDPDSERGGRRSARGRPHGPWLIEETAIRYSGPFLELYEDAVRKPDGTPGTYTTVTLKPGVAVLPVGENGQVYLTRQFRYAIGRESVEVATGAIEGDENPRVAAERELREELGLLAGDWNDLGMFDMDTSIVRCPVRLFLAGALRPTSADPDPTERIRRITLSFDDAVGMVLNGGITHAPSCVLILKAAHARRDTGRPAR